MKATFASLTLTVLLGVAGMTDALAHEDRTEGASLHWITHQAAVRGQQGQAAATKFAAVADYGEGTALVRMNQNLPLKAQTAGNQPVHNEYEEGTASMHAGHPR